MTAEGRAERGHLAYVKMSADAFNTEGSGVALEELLKYELRRNGAEGENVIVLAIQTDATALHLEKVWEALVA